MTFIFIFKNQKFCVDSFNVSFVMIMMIYDEIQIYYQKLW